jgi:hypothetical protein
MRSLFLILLLVCTCLTDLRADMFADALALEKQGQHAQAAARGGYVPHSVGSLHSTALRCAVLLRRTECVEPQTTVEEC